MAHKARPLLDRFLEKFEAITETGCWIWTGSILKTGYGGICSGADARTLKASRVSYQLFRGEIPAGRQVLHTCDVPLCVNPSHLFLGTNVDNHADKARKGRARNQYTVLRP